MNTECQRNKIGPVFSQPIGSRSPAWRDPVEEFHSEFKTKEASLWTKQILFCYVKWKINIGGRRAWEGGVVLFIMLYKEVPILQSRDETRVCDHSNKRYKLSSTFLWCCLSCCTKKEVIFEFKNETLYLPHLQGKLWAWLVLIL